MYLMKNRCVPYSEEKYKEKTNKRYYIPARYSRKRKTDRNISSIIKTEDLV